MTMYPSSFRGKKCEYAMRSGMQKVQGQKWEAEANDVAERGAQKRTMAIGVER